MPSPRPTLLTLLLLLLPLPYLRTSPPPRYLLLIPRTHLLHEALLTIDAHSDGHLAHYLATCTRLHIDLYSGAVLNLLWQAVWVMYSLWAGELLLPGWLVLLTQLLVLVDLPFDLLGLFGTRPVVRVWGLARARALALEVGTRREWTEWRLGLPEWAFVMGFSLVGVLYRVLMLGRFPTAVVVVEVVLVVVETVEEWWGDGRV